MVVTSAPSAKRSEVRTRGGVFPLPFQGDNAALVTGVLRGHPGASEEFHRRFVRRIHGLLYRLLGPDPEIEDVLHDCFVRALEALPKLSDPQALDAWVMGVTVRTARTRLQRKARRWWLRLVPDESMPEPAAPSEDPEVREALSALYRVLDGLPVDERMALVLRNAEKMTVAEAAQAVGTSQSTLKRRLQRAEKAFAERAPREPALLGWLGGGAP